MLVNSRNSTILPQRPSTGGESTFRRGSAISSRPEILIPEETCWRVEQARRATALVDGEAYFSALRAAMLRAERQVFIIGWDIDGRIELPRIDETDDAPESLRDFIRHLAARKPDLRIHILLWDYTILYADDREALPGWSFDWMTPENVRFVLDNKLPVGASHHQKIVTIDDRIAFVGGIDLTRGRWDTRDHAPDDPRRMDRAGESHGPFHDVQLAVDGAAAIAVGDHCRWRWRWRWRELTDEDLERVETGSDPWPNDLPADWNDVAVGVARTLPATADRAEVREILALYLEGIAQAEKEIYIENQYLTVNPIAEALALRLAEPDGPAVILVTQWRSSAWLEEQVMGVGRDRFLAHLHAADPHDRLRVLTPLVPGVSKEEYNLHAKIAVFDDRLVQVGSANLNNRSMGHDSECNLAIDCTTDPARQAARDFRDGLLAEHFGMELDALRSELDRHGSLVRAIDALQSREGRRLVNLGFPSTPPEQGDFVTALGDPEEPLQVTDFLRRNVPELSPKRMRALSWWPIWTAALLLILIGVAALWL